jgi:hypothetical protein
MTYENSLKSIRTSNRLANRRTLTILGLSGLIVVHFLDLPSKIAEVPYLACAYGAAILAAGILIERIASRDRAIDYLASAALALSVLVAFVINRSVGMPLATDDIGNWLEPLGFLSLFIEASLVYQSARGFVLARKVHGANAHKGANSLSLQVQAQKLAA